mgnify:FL=1
MKKICSVILSCALLLGLLVVPGAAAEPAAKQDFESEYTAYASINSVSSSYSVSNAEYHGGSCSLKYDYNYKASNKYDLVNLTYNDDLKLTPGKTYVVSFWLMAPTPEKATSESTAIRLYANSAWVNPWTDAGWNVGQQVVFIDSSFNYGVWQQYTCTVKLSENQNALHLYVLDGKHIFYIDDITATELVPVTVDFKEADGTVIDQRMGLPGSALTLPRTPEKEGYSFDGWYEDADFTTAFTGTTFPIASTTLYAKFSDCSIYDKYLDTSATYVANGNTVSAADGVLKVTRSTAGNTWFTLTPTTNEYALKEGNTYTVSFDVLFDSDYIAGAIGSKNTLYINQNPENAADFYIGKKSDWQSVSYNFKALAGYLRVYTWGSVANSTIQFKNLKITPVTVQTDLEKAVAAELEYQGSSLRPEDAEKKANPIPGNNGEAAIRFKSKISNKLLNEGITVSKVHYSVVEYGHTYFREDLMGGNTVLDIGTTYTNGKAAKNAVAYRKENGAVTTDIWFSKDETNVTYTAALYNFTEQSYTLTYVARPYVKLVADNSTEEITVYGANTQFAAFNDVADRAFYAHPGDVYNRAAAYTDVNGDSWSESYEIRSALYNTVLSKLSGQGFNYLAPAVAAK